MPRYLFNVHDGEDHPDLVGTILDGPTHAHDQAIEAAGEMLRDKGRDHWAGNDWRMDVVDDAGAIVCRLRFSAEC